MLFFWNPDPRQAPELYFVVIGLWGVAHAVWDTQINGILPINILDLEKELKSKYFFKCSPLWSYI